MGIPPTVFFLLVNSLAIIGFTSPYDSFGLFSTSVKAVIGILMEHVLNLYTDFDNTAIFTALILLVQEDPAVV